MSLTAAGLKALERATTRERGNICPTRLHAAAETAMLRRLDRDGFIEWVAKGVPCINEAGRAALARATAPKPRMVPYQDPLAPERANPYRWMRDAVIVVDSVRKSG